MGGRGRTTRNKDRWDWVQELSDDRLQKYGHMSAYKAQHDNHQKGPLNFALAKEHERRFGFKPNWAVPGAKQSDFYQKSGYGIDYYPEGKK